MARGTTYGAVDSPPGPSMAAIDSPAGPSILWKQNLVIYPRIYRRWSGRTKCGGTIGGVTDLY